MYELTKVNVDYDNQEIKEEYVLFKKRPTKEELDNLPITKVYYDCNEELDENFKTSKITYLYFGKDFNQPVDNLPASLTHLEFGSYFNKSVDFLPSSLEELEIYNEDYSHDLMNLPVSLKKLSVPCYYKGQIVLPKDCVLKKIE